MWFPIQKNMFYMTWRRIHAFQGYETIWQLHILDIYIQSIEESFVGVNRKTPWIYFYTRKHNAINLFNK